MKNNSINIENFGQYVEQKINDRLFVSNIFKIFEKEQNNSKNSISYKNIMYCRRMGNTVTVVFLCLWAILCQRIFIVSLGRLLLVAFLYLTQMFQHALLFRRSVLFFSGSCRFPAGLAFLLGKVTFIRFLVLEQFSGHVKKIELRV